MARIVEIETIEMSKKLKWVAIASFSGPNEDSDARRWVWDLLSGLRVNQMRPEFRITDFEGNVV